MYNQYKIQLGFIAILICIFGFGISPIQANWTDDFSSSNFNNWTSWGEDYSGDVIKEIDATWEVVDQTLTSPGTYTSGYYNIACRQLNVEEGTWQFDHFWSSASHNIIFTAVIFGDIADHRGESSSEWAETGFELQFYNFVSLGIQDYIDLKVWNGDRPSIDTNRSYLEDNASNTWQHIEVVRDDMINIYLNGSEILSLPSHKDLLSTLDYLCVITGIGLNTKFDNFNATADPSLVFGEEDTTIVPSLTIGILTVATLVVIRKKPQI